MKLELKPFQEDAVTRLRVRATLAAGEVAQTGQSQALILSAPTGSGKTVIATDWLERLARGDDAHGPEPDATFLWLTDQPELNRQTCSKLLDSSDLFDEKRLVTVEADFDQPGFGPGIVYFLNTQKLSKTSGLVREGDARAHTLWETIANTVAERPASFWVVIDEAHRGMRENEAHHSRAEARTIVQKFVKGSEEIPAVPLIFGISATVQRFTDLLAGTTRTQRHVAVEIDEVRSSGLLKDTVVLFHPDEDQPSDLTLLAAAAERLEYFGHRWHSYCIDEQEPPVRPILAVQVDDGTKTGPTKLTKSDMGAALETLEGILGPLGPDEVAHAFQEGSTVLVGGNGRALHYVPPSDIEGRADLRVVFFKRSLTTGWDCPRSEVMMSFRTARDETLIAQLVGRMVRTPLARRVDGPEILSSVSLFLPHYDAPALDSVIKRLSEPDPEHGLPGGDVVRGNDLVTLTPDTGLQEALDAANGLSQYKVDRVAKVGSVKRLTRLGFRLATDGLDSSADGVFRDALVEVLHQQRDGRENDVAFRDRVDEAARIDVREVTVALGATTPTSSASLKLNAEARNVEQAYAEALRRLGDGDVGAAYLKRRATEESTHQIGRFKQELFALMELAVVRQAVDSRAEQLADDALDHHAVAINGLPDGKRQQYRAIRRQGATARPEPWSAPDSIEGPKKGQSWGKHLYVKPEGGFSCSLNTLERRVLTQELGRDEVMAWIRNEPRKPWAFSTTYERHGEERAMYPDFLLFRRANGTVVCDILEPHSQRESDSTAKARGLARFAEKHGHEFGRIELIDEVDGEIKRLSLTQSQNLQKVKAVNNDEHLRQLFEAA